MFILAAVCFEHNCLACEKEEIAYTTKNIRYGHSFTGRFTLFFYFGGNDRKRDLFSVSVRLNWLVLKSTVRRRRRRSRESWVCCRRSIKLWTGLTCRGTFRAHAVFQSHKTVRSWLEKKESRQSAGMGEQADTAFKTTGSKWLLPVSGYLGLSLDQVGSTHRTSRSVK